MKKETKVKSLEDKNYEKIEKVGLTRIETSQLPKEIPDFKNSFESKDSIIKKWLSDWICSGIKKGTLKENSLLPKKNDLAYYLGVSVGTVQNAIRSVEDTGIIESKQRIGTMIRNSSAQSPIIRKASSKREKVITLIKKYIVENGLKTGDTLPSSRALSSLIGNSTNTIRLALDNLKASGYIEATAFRSNEANWIVKKVPEITEEEKAFNETDLKSDTLVKKVKKDLLSYIQNNFKIGDKLPAHFELSETLKVSVKTVHDAVRSLIDDGILLSRRGRYGTTIIKMPNEPAILQPINEVSICQREKLDTIFAKAEDAQFYSYQKTESAIKSYIGSNFEIGDKIPSMEALSERFDVSSNTVRKALQNLADQGYVTFSRGRYGGTFVTELPEPENKEAYRWVAVSPQYTISYDSQN